MCTYIAHDLGKTSDVNMASKRWDASRSFETKRLAQAVCGLTLGKQTAGCQHDSNLLAPMHCLNFLQPRSLQAEETLPSKLGPNFLCRMPTASKSGLGWQPERGEVAVGVKTSGSKGVLLIEVLGF